METTTETSENGTGPEASDGERRGLAEIFRFSMFVHVGPGAETCEDGEDGSCGNPTHFHAWCRLPNQFQAKSIREKALAAKARKMRRMRDSESDAFAILNGEMEELRRVAEPSDLIEEIIGRNYWRDQMAAVAAVSEMEDFETIREDRERLRALDEVEEGDRDSEEYEELQRHVDSYYTAVDEKRGEEQEPQREALGAKPIEELVEIVREERIGAEATEDFITEFSLWQTYICTLRPVDPDKGNPRERAFQSIDHLKDAAPEVVGMLESTFRELEAAMGGRGAVGN